MKKLYSLLSLLIASGLMNAQSVDCFSGRFDTEVFATYDLTSNVTYGANADYNGTNTVLTMDIYQPHADTMVQRPLIIWVHGGSFLSGTKNDLDVTTLCQHFAKRGYVCASINYRLGISFPYNQANATNAVYRSVQDLKAAIRFFRKDAATANTYTIDPTIIYAGGSSAGAFAALHLAYMDNYAELPTTIDTTALGNLDGNSGNPGYSSNVNAIVDLCGALGNKTWMHSTDIPFCAMHGDHDNTVPYATDVIKLLGFPIMTVDGSYSLAHYADSIGLYNQFYTFFGSDHVPYYSSATFMDTTVRFVSNFLFRQLGCTPSDLNPLPNTFNTTSGINELASEYYFYPNPTSGVIRVKSQKSFTTLTITDLQGRIVLSKKVESNETELNLSELKGLYILLGDKKVIGKVVVN